MYLKGTVISNLKENYTILKGIRKKTVGLNARLTSL